MHQVIFLFIFYIISDIEKGRVIVPKVLETFGRLCLFYLIVIEPSLTIGDNLT